VTLAVVLAALACAACGGASDADLARKAVRSFYGDWVDGKGAAACHRLTAESRRQAVASWVRAPRGSTCAHVLNAIWALAGPFGGLEHWKRARVGRVRFDGQRAFVAWDPPGAARDQKGTWTRQVGGRWLVDIAWRR
jgi:hypothetical protein